MGNKINLEGEITYAKIAFPRKFDNEYTKVKERVFNGLTTQMVNIALGMFEYKGLPETLSSREMELQMIYNGMCIISKVDGKLYALRGGYAGECNYLYIPKFVTVTNPYLDGNKGFAKQLEIDKECVVIWNDEMIAGLFDLISLYGCQITEGEMTLRLQLINARANKFLSATDDKVKEDAVKVLNDLDAGKLGVIGDSIELEGMLKALNAIEMSSSKSETIKSTIEQLQYYWAKFFISLGLNDNYNMKRESLNGTETSVNENTLFALPLMMLDCRKVGLERLNKLYGTNATVEFKGVWAQAYKKYLLSLKAEKEEVDAIGKGKAVQDDSQKAEEPRPEEDKSEEDKPEERKSDE